MDLHGGTDAQDLKSFKRTREEREDEKQQEVECMKAKDMNTGIIPAFPFSLQPFTFSLCFFPPLPPDGRYWYYSSDKEKRFKQ